MTTNVSSSIDRLTAGVDTLPNISQIRYPKHGPEDPSCMRCADDLEGERCPKRGIIVCEVCGKSFKQKSTLKRQIAAVHKELRNYVCEVCGQDFTRKTTMNKHIDVIHKGRRDFVCDVCGRTFAGKSNPNRHMDLVHTELRPFVCEVCGEDFKQKKVLNEHIDAVHKE
ncbi:unnamed protein product [Dibothriocephalus latus]|uniref:C2H2-type domain-containing protein n=1 Tax=Dibothriocephalus latus TaxID=60516 RepID=A0A3P6PM49_DIBLA|nr:unnamed protein product [Dibothriocephalus latus]